MHLVESHTKKYTNGFVTIFIVFYSENVLFCILYIMYLTSMVLKQVYEFVLVF